MGDASQRWAEMVRDRLASMRQAGPDASSAAFWDARARRFASAGFATASRQDPLLVRLRGAARRTSTVLDVGCGPGRFTLALAPRVREAVGVDPSGRMLAMLRKEARRQELDNVRTVQGRWEDVDVEPADVVVCAYVLPLVEDAANFLQKLEDARRGRAFLYLGAASADLVTDPLWRHFHGRPRPPAPTYLDAVSVLRELGVRPDVEVVEVLVRTRFPDLSRAVSHYRDMLLLPGTAAVRAELRDVLGSWLAARPDGLGPPLRTMPAAILSWGA